ncbi:formylmethionine deformylase [Chytriomyces sp. MP71]|nr:formylmethionine deformylase [Chytriomyces sp. MP71]
MSNVLRLGNPLLSKTSEFIPRAELGSSASLWRQAALLAQTLTDFRLKHGFGRAIAAPQIGVLQRFIALDLSANAAKARRNSLASSLDWRNGPVILFNPRITSHSVKTLSMWDDCMCFPDILVRVRRFERIDLEFDAGDGTYFKFRDLEFEEAELIQHELDHLDGVLAVDLALNKDEIVSREDFAKRKDHYLAQVDYITEGFVV